MPEHRSKRRSIQWQRQSPPRPAHWLDLRPTHGRALRLLLYGLQTLRTFSWIRWVKLTSLIDPPLLPNAKIVLRLLIEKIHARRKVSLVLAKDLGSGDESDILNGAIRVVKFGDQKTDTLRTPNLPNGVHSSRPNRGKLRAAQCLQCWKCFGITYFT